MIRLYLIGIVMGIADLIPGVSGGTIAFAAGIYEELLESIKSLQLQNVQDIAWPFLLPLGLGIATSVFLASRLFYFLLNAFPVPLFAFFLGLILASALFCSRKADLKRPSHWGVLLAAAAAAYWVSGISQVDFLGVSFLGLALAGMLGACAMLLPGISGSYLLQLFGVYTLVLAALNAPFTPASLKVLFAIALGVSIGFVVFSRLVSWLMNRLTTWTYAALVGFMLGGTRAIWPFSKEEWILAILFTLMGFFLFILLELKVKKRELIRRV